MKLSWNRAKGLAMLVVVLIAWGIGYIVKLPPALSDELWGTYVRDLPEGTVDHTYLSVDGGFHIWNEGAELFLYGTYEKVGENQYLMKGKHIPEEVVTVEDHRLTFMGMGFVKHSDTPITVNHSLEKARDNDRKTAAQLAFVSDHDWYYGGYYGTYGAVDAEGNLTSLRFAVGEDDTFCIYDEMTGVCLLEGSAECEPDYFRLMAEGMEPQTVYHQKSGFVMTLDGQDTVFVQMSEEMPEK